ncbi:helix-turn-helix transcriptional regulator [Propionibacteriaceae bacterium Y1685]
MAQAMMVTVHPDARDAPLVGRTVELDRLCHAVGLGGQRPGAGEPAPAVLLSGDAGIGKTRTLRELTRRAASAGHRVLLGHCLDLGESAIAFQPFTEVLSALTEAERDAAAARYEALGALLPGRSISGGSDSRGLFAAMVATLEELATERPLLVVIEDLHWADSSTHHLIRYLLGTWFSQQVHLVLSYRSDDLHRRHPLRPHIAEWGRLPGVQRVDLAPLADDAVADLVRARATVAPDGLADIIRRAEGNAFFVEELLDAAQDGESLPPTLADLLLVRLDRLDEAARTVVGAIACGGSFVTDELLGEVLGLSPRELESALRQAVDHKILTRGSSDGYCFRHALLSEVVHDDLLPGERRRLHRSYLDVLTAEGADARAAEVALHAVEAGALDVAFNARVAAGDQAVAVHGHDVAAVHYERALELADHAPADADLTQLVIKASEASTASGRHGRAMALVRDRLDHRPTTTAERARLLVAYGMAAVVGDQLPVAAPAAQEALHLTAEEPSELRALAENLYANVALEERRNTDAEFWAAQARSLGQRLGLTTVVTDANTIIEKVRSRTGHDVEDTKRRLNALIAVTHAEGNVVGELRATHHLAFLQHDLGELDQAEETFLQTMERARQAGRTWAPYGFDGRLFAAVTAYMRGRWDRVLTLRKVGVPAPTPTADALLDAVVLLVRVGRGDPHAVAEAERLRPLWSSDVVLAVHAGTSTIDGAPDAATAIDRHRELVEVLWQTWRSRPPGLLRMAGLLAGRLASLADRSSAGERSGWGSVVDEAAARARQHADDRGHPGPEGRAWQARLRAEELRLQWRAGDTDVDLEALVAAWRSAHASFVELGEPYEVARSATRLAAAVHAAGDQQEADTLLSSARATAQDLGAVPLLNEIAELSPGSMGSPEAGLTARESEVLGHLVEGRTNGEIARVLFISPKTVSVHVSNLLAKLGAGTRTEAAAIARRRGLS